VSYVQQGRAALLRALPVALDDRLVDLCTLLVLRRGEATTREDVHDAWSVWQSREQPDHRSLRRQDDDDH
jgi:DNA-binding winged helix-turn-helix (wHTH) protein